jgi:hypothetical protein
MKWSVGGGGGVVGGTVLTFFSFFLNRWFLVSFSFSLSFVSTHRHMRDAPTAQFIDRYLTRPTPHVLKSGASANADVLRIQLTKAQDIIHQLDEKVAEGYVPLVVVVLTCVNMLIHTAC